MQFEAVFHFAKTEPTGNIEIVIGILNERNSLPVISMRCIYFCLEAFVALHIGSTEGLWPFPVIRP